MPPIKCTPCRVTFNGLRYRVYSDGSVSLSISFEEAKNFPTVKDVLSYESETFDRYSPDSSIAKAVRKEAARQRRNRSSRERHQAMRDLGLKRTPYGYE